MPIAETDIRHTHWIGKPRDAGQKLRPIIVNSVRYNDRKNAFNRKITKSKKVCNYGEFNSHSFERVGK